ncbi:MAG TPA: type III-B CRISPR module RAMP protein Cmr4 [Cyanobacteria bacterium UBA12227]|nr:type III-B CRISPR module RAMP protein Cmr4 [Cyanobacteria bacterium UBA12227]HAX85325.1 type III-B CRISPR module RAMP protein Cmr4 [Cyanobacteria bacterium UBA11370]HBY81752.1 type III-B CRISPR module RAMP protein Cmr4 [Cyanobacteria bacterium UBA11148]
MYHKAYGIIETQAPLHVGASAGEESGNLNLIFRDQFTQTGIIPGSSIRGRFRADMRQKNPTEVDKWYGHEASAGKEDGGTTEAIIKFEYASIVWLPVYCPNQPIVRVSCPALLNRYQKITGKAVTEIKPYSYFGKAASKTLFFNLGFLPLKTEDATLKECFPKELQKSPKHLLLVVDDTEISMIHDMALYRQSRVALESDKKKAKKGAFFDVEALPEGTIMAFPIAMRKMYDNQSVEWEQFLQDSKFTQQDKEDKELYFGGLESIGFGRTKVFVTSHPSNPDQNS